MIGRAESRHEIRFLEMERRPGRTGERMDLFLTSDFERQREVQRETGRNDSGQSIELNLFATGSFRAAEASGGRVAEHASGVFRHGLEWSTAPMQCSMADEDERGTL